MGLNAVSYSIEAVDEIREVLKGADPAQTEKLESEVLKAKKILVGGAGSSLLSMKFFAMRLMQFGFPTYLVGEVCTPSIREGDLLILGSISGSTPVILAMAQKAKAAGARIAVITMNEQGTISQMADCVVKVGNDMIREGAGDPDGWNGEEFNSIRPSGNILEIAMAVLLDCVICRLMAKTRQALDVLSRNHANLE